MEAHGADLSRTADRFESSAWHGEVLRERVQRVAEDKKSFIGWDDAKRQRRKCLL